jgi:hypothetical protein
VKDLRNILEDNETLKSMLKDLTEEESEILKSRLAPMLESLQSSMNSIYKKMANKDNYDSILKEIVGDIDVKR